jgi:hypothetical protein
VVKEGGEMTQTMYAHVNKRIFKKGTKKEEKWNKLLYTIKKNRLTKKNIFWKKKT